MVPIIKNILISGTIPELSEPLSIAGIITPIHLIYGEFIIEDIGNLVCISFERVLTGTDAADHQRTRALKLVEKAGLYWCHQLLCAIAYNPPHNQFRKIIISTDVRIMIVHTRNRINRSTTKVNSGGIPDTCIVYISRWNNLGLSHYQQVSFRGPIISQPTAPIPIRFYQILKHKPIVTIQIS